MEAAALILAAIVVLAGMLAARPAKRWYRKVRRRRGGIYLWRVDHHRKRFRRVTGYVGLTNSFYHRKRQHLGMDSRVAAKGWSDLRPRCYEVIRLPWWLCWRWVLGPLETLVILATWPVYNVQKNRWNPRRRTLGQAAMDRVKRDQRRVSR